MATSRTTDSIPPAPDHGAESRLHAWHQTLRRVAVTALGVGLFTSAFSIAATQISFAIAVLCWLPLLLAGRHETCFRSIRIPLTIAGLYVAWLVIAALLSPSPLASLGTIREEWLFLMIPLVLSLANNEQRLRNLCLALAAGVALAGTYGILQHFTGWYWFKEGGLHSVNGVYRLSGNFSHPLTYGYYVVLSGLFLLTLIISRFKDYPGWRRWLLVVGCSAGLIAAALCNSRGPLVALGVGLLALGILFRKTVWIVVIVAICATGAFVVAPGVANELMNRVGRDLNTDNRLGRFYIWSQSADIAIENPIGGVGPGNFGQHYNARLPSDAPGHERQSHAHNDYLNIAAIAGFPALILYLALWGAMLWLMWRHSRCGKADSIQDGLVKATLVLSLAFATGSLFEAVFADEELRQLLMVIWGLGLTSIIRPAAN